MKKKAIGVFILAAALLFTGCRNNKVAPSLDISSSVPPVNEMSDIDVVTTASIVNDNAAFEKAISNSGTWIIATLNVLTFSNAVVLDGVFKNGEKDANGQDIIQRKIALYTQDANRNVTARFTLTAPKMTINSPEASIQHGTFAGDLYVSEKNFQLVDAIVDGSVYFTNEEAQYTFKMDADSSVTGSQELQK